MVANALYSMHRHHWHVLVCPELSELWEWAQTVRNGKYHWEAKDGIFFIGF